MQNRTWVSLVGGFTSRIINIPSIIVAVLTIAYTYNYFTQEFSPTGDFYHYQSFVEALARGTLDLSIPGFHGVDIFALPYYLLTRSPTAVMNVNGFIAIFLPLTGYLTGKSLYGKWGGVLLSCIVASMPFVTFSYLLGFTNSTYILFVLLTILLAHRKEAWMPWGISMITKPFSVCLLPFLLSRGMRRQHLVYGLLIPAIYAGIQYMQLGTLSLGVHTEMDAGNFFRGFGHMLKNIHVAAHGIFSVHDFKAWNPAGTGMQNMLHTSPIFVVLGLLAWTEKHGIPLILSGIFGILLNTILPSIDFFYLDTGVLLLTIAAIPILLRHPLLLPIIVITLNFQWWYFERFSDLRMNPSVTNAVFNTSYIFDVLVILWLIIYLFHNKRYVRIIHAIYKSIAPQS